MLHIFFILIFNLISSKDNLLKLTDLPEPTDCQDVYNKGFTTSGIYLISPDSTKTLTVYCEQELDGGGWTVGSYFDLQNHIK